MPDIPPILEVRKALKTLELFVDGIGNVFAPSSVKLAPTVMARITSITPIPKSWKARVVVILQECGPLFPREVRDEYVRRGWPEPPKGAKSNVAKMIRSTLAYLKKNDLVDVVDGKYGFSPE